MDTAASAHSEPTAARPPIWREFVSFGLAVGGGAGDRRIHPRSLGRGPDHR